MSNIAVGQIVFNPNPAAAFPIMDRQPKTRQPIDDELLKKTKNLIDLFKQNEKSLNQMMKTILLNWND